MDILGSFFIQLTHRLGPWSSTGCSDDIHNMLESLSSVYPSRGSFFLTQPIAFGIGEPASIRERSFGPHIARR